MICSFSWGPCPEAFKNRASDKENAFIAHYEEGIKIEEFNELSDIAGNQNLRVEITQFADQSGPSIIIFADEKDAYSIISALAK